MRSSYTLTIRESGVSAEARWNNGHVRESQTRGILPNVRSRSQERWYDANGSSSSLFACQGFFCDLSSAFGFRTFSLDNVTAGRYSAECHNVPVFSHDI
jgi:hypothetical protein